MKNFKWNERLICLAVACAIFLVEFVITRFGNMPSDYLIDWSTRTTLIPLVVVTIIALIPNLKMIALSFPIGHVLGVIVGSIFGTSGIGQGGGLQSNHWLFYICTLLAVILVAVILQIVTLVKARQKTK